MLPARFLLLLAIAAVPLCAASAQPAAAPCANEGPYRHFDFWIGSWEVRLPNGNLAGTNTIETADNGCLLIERWSSASGGSGTSMNYIDPADRQWKQVWVDAQGGVIYLSGGLEDGAMRLAGERIDAAGSATLLRGTWTPLDDGRVRQHFEQSSDDGATWTTWFDGYYSRTDR